MPDYRYRIFPRFDRYIGIDYSGAKHSDASLPGLRVYCSESDEEPREVLPPPSKKKYWSRRGLAEWLKARLAERTPTIVGIDHAFSFPEQYFQRHGLEESWDRFLDDFHEHWPTDELGLTVDDIRFGRAGAGSLRGGESKWKRLTEKLAGGAKSVFHFDVKGQVAKSTHAGLPWLRHLRRDVLDQVHFWPFDGWNVSSGRSAVVEVYPALWSRGFAREERNGDQHDAFSVAAWLSMSDRDGSLAPYLGPNPWGFLSSREEAHAGMKEGWILGVSGQYAQPRMARFALRDESESLAFTEALSGSPLYSAIGREIHPFTSAPVAWTVDLQELAQVVGCLERFAAERQQGRHRPQASVARELAHRYRDHAEWFKLACHT